MPVSPDAPLPAPDAAACLRFLQTPTAHQGHAAGCDSVQTVQTHMSWVFLVGAHVLKLKKAVRYPFLDFATPEAREFYCREELRLNARLAPGVYLGLMVLHWDGRALALVDADTRPAGGCTLDWLVLMRRLPAERLLDRALAEGRAGPDDIDAVARTLVTFYRSAAAQLLTPEDYVLRYQRELAASRELLLRPQFQLPGAARALERCDRALARHATLLRERVAAGRIVDGHGDLRPEHVCLNTPPVVIDALEFNAALRQVDPFDELAFLALECEMAGAAWVGPRLLAGCAEALGGAPPPALMALYTATRALLRARLAIAHLLDPEPRTPERWAPQAQRYVSRALLALDELDALSAATPADSR